MKNIYFAFLPGICALLISLGTIARRAGAPCARCPRHAHCTNATACRCDPGFTSLSGKDIFNSLSEISSVVNPYVYLVET
ncbi:adhesion G protein-coupled receptor E3-like [Trichechus manatus latirostris]|uniref:Adhesion G protein-coupled receptor E3-like n=1 Tax=Trichechus manatus latirostris TaxID=127582 RepID=A0A2Y9QG43_TRIMA|nr:adhesion G protein-coupled receptor E3-like [Trichechus manatus latirostris]